MSHCLPVQSSADSFRFVLRLGDSCLILSQRLIDWCGIAPELEEDVALSNIALDLLGQARLWLEYAGGLEGAGRDEDRLAFWRDDHEFLNLLLVEQPNGNFAETQMRQFFFDTWHVLVLKALRQSPDTAVAAIAGKAVKEAGYHLRRSSQWVVRLGDGTALSHERAQAAIDALWDYIGEMFECDDTDARLLAQGRGCDFAALRAPWRDYVGRVFADATLAVPEATSFQTGGKLGRHTEHLSALLAEMQSLQRAHPGAQW